MPTGYSYAQDQLRRRDVRGGAGAGPRTRPNALRDAAAQVQRGAQRTVDFVNDTTAKTKTGGRAVGKRLRAAGTAVKTPLAGFKAGAGAALRASTVAAVPLLAAEGAVRLGAGGQALEEIKAAQQEQGGLRRFVPAALDFIGRGLAEQYAKNAPEILGGLPQSTIDAAEANNVSAFDDLRVTGPGSATEVLRRTTPRAATGPASTSAVTAVSAPAKPTLRQPGQVKGNPALTRRLADLRRQTDVISGISDATRNDRQRDYLTKLARFGPAQQGNEWQTWARDARVLKGRGRPGEVETYALDQEAQAARDVNSTTLRQGASEALGEDTDSAGLTANQVLQGQLSGQRNQIALRRANTEAAGLRGDDEAKAEERRQANQTRAAELYSSDPEEQRAYQARRESVANRAGIDLAGDAKTVQQLDDLVAVDILLADRAQAASGVLGSFGDAPGGEQLQNVLDFIPGLSREDKDFYSQSPEEITGVLGEYLIKGTVRGVDIRDSEGNETTLKTRERLLRELRQRLEQDRGA